jgi:hypothetical protein
VRNIRADVVPVNNPVRRPGGVNFVETTPRDACFSLRQKSVTRAL